MTDPGIVPPYLRRDPDLEWIARRVARLEQRIDIAFPESDPTLSEWGLPFDHDTIPEGGPDNAGDD